MKKNIFRTHRALTLVLLALTLVLSACNKKDDEPSGGGGDDTPTSTTTYTIMQYSVSDKTFDAPFNAHLKEITDLGNLSHVNFTFRHKYSPEYVAKNPEYAGVLTGAYTKGDWENFGMLTGTDSGYRMDDPQNLADFIKESMENYPADKYILILDGHGQVFDLSDVPVQPSYEPGQEKHPAVRSILPDNNFSTSNCMSIFELQKALSLVGRKMDLVYMDLCLTNTIEYMYQLRNDVDYYVASLHPSYSRSYAPFITALQKSDDFESVIKGYMDTTINEWTKEMFVQSPCDVNLFKLDRVEGIVTAFKDYAQELVKVRNKAIEDGKYATEFACYNSIQLYDDMKLVIDTIPVDGEIYHKWSHVNGVLYPTSSPMVGNTEDIIAVRKDWSGAVDMVSACTRLAAALQSETLQTKAQAVSAAVKQAQIYSVFGNSQVSWLTQVSCGVLWMYKDSYTQEYVKYKSLQERYKLLDFDKAVDWDAFLKQNESFYEYTKD